MPKITYVALTRTGETVSGVMDAVSTREALTQLRERGMTPLDVTAGMSFRIHRRVNRAQAAQVLRRLATVVARGGAPLAEILPSLVDEEDLPHVRTVLAGVRDSILRDSLPMSRALGRYPEVFPTVVTSRIAAGEAAGALDNALEDAALFLEQGVRTQSRLIGALSYPIVIISLALIIVSVLSATIMPRFVTFYAQSGVPLPLVTRIVVGFGLMLAHWWFLVIGFVIGAGWGARRLLARQDVRDRLDYIRWNLWGWRRVERALAWSRWAQAMTMLYAQGTEILHALQLACDASGTAVIRDVSDLLVRRMSEQGHLREALDEAGVFPPILRTSVGVGERYGTIREMLSEAATWYSREAETILEQLPNLLQPIAVVIVGALVGFMVLSLYTPMFNMYGVINQLH